MINIIIILVEEPKAVIKYDKSGNHRTKDKIMQANWRAITGISYASYLINVRYKAMAELMMKSVLREGQ